MLLVVNIGNSNIRFGIFQADECKYSWTVNSKINRTEDEYFTLFKAGYLQHSIDEKKIKKLVIGSVVPKHTRPICNALERIHTFPPFLVTSQTPSCVKHHSPELGTDLYANAVGAYERLKKKCIVIDFGTALTLIAVGDTGKMLGVVIAPGINTALESLVNNTAQLFDIELTVPKNVLGNDTVSCMQSGMVYGYLSMIEGLIVRIKKEMGEETHVISTGGLCHLFENLTDKIDYTDKLHTIKGLKLIYEQSKARI